MNAIKTFVAGALVAGTINLTPHEAMIAGAANSIVYSQFFFPSTTHQDTPYYHPQLWNLFEGNRFSHARIFRGGAKTTLARLVVSKRIAYGIGRTILFVSKSEDHAIESVRWLKAQVEWNPVWAQTFGLTPGEKWTESFIEIRQTLRDELTGADKISRVYVKALGIMGSIRGINIEDRRPDTIVADDIVDAENSQTKDQREKINDLFLSDLKDSLVPASEDPTAMMTLLQTPFHEDDCSGICMKSDLFACLCVGILTDEDDSKAESSWPARWSKEEILKEKTDAIKLNKLSVWLREKMCKIVSKETAEFKEEWLKYWTVLPPAAVFIGAIDPAPILSDAARASNAQTDLQAIMVAAYYRGLKFIVEYKTARDQDPEAVSRELDRLGRKYHIRRWGVEGVAYQRTLKWYLEREMQAGRLKHIHIVEIPAPKGKHERIVQAHSGRASSGSLYIHESHVEFKEQYTQYPNVKFKDLLDVSAMCDMTITPRQEGVVIDAEFEEVEDGTKALGWERPCP